MISQNQSTSNSNYKTFNTMMKLTINFLLIGSAFAGSFPPPGKEYIEPAPDAQRSNCPAINVSI